MVCYNKINSWDRYLIWILFIVALTFRIVYILLFYDPQFLEKGDNRQYLVFAEQMLDQGLFVKNINVDNEIAGRWSILGPGYPLIISVFLHFFGHNYFLIFLFNALLTSLAAIVIYLTANEIFNVKYLSLAILIWGVFYINYYKYTPFLLKESLVFILLPLSILFLIKELKNRGKVSWNMLFLILSYIYLIHADERYFFYFPFLTMLFFFFYKYDFKLFSKKQLIFVCSVLLLMTPWLIRNYQVYGQIVVLTERTTKVTSLIWGEDLTSKYAYNSNKSVSPQYEEEAYRYIDKTSKETISPPYKYGPKEKYIKAVIHFWKPTYFKTGYINDGLRKQKWSLGHNIVSLIFYGIFLPFYFLGLIWLIYKRDEILTLFLALIPIIQMIIHVVLVHVLERYRNPVDCFVVTIALCFLYKLSLYFFKKKSFKFPVTNNSRNLE